MTKEIDLVKPRRPATCRCPACNPMHNPAFQGVGSKTQRAANARKVCAMCKGTREVATNAAAAYLAADSDESPVTVNLSRPTWLARAIPVHSATSESHAALRLSD